MIARRLLLQATTMAVLQIIEGGPAQPDVDASGVSSHEPDHEGAYTAIGYDGPQLYAAWLIDHREKARSTFSINDLSELISFINDLGMSKLVFVDWVKHSGGNVEALEVRLEHVGSGYQNATDEITSAVTAGIHFLTPPIVSSSTTVS